MPTFERKDSEIARILQDAIGDSARVVPYHGAGFHRSFKILSTDDCRQIDRIDFDARDYIAFHDADPMTWKPHLTKRYGSRFENARPRHSMPALSA